MLAAGLQYQAPETRVKAYHTMKVIQTSDVLLHLRDASSLLLLRFLEGHRRRNRFMYMMKTCLLTLSTSMNVTIRRRNGQCTIRNGAALRLQMTKRMKAIDFVCDPNLLNPIYFLPTHPFVCSVSCYCIRPQDPSGRVWYQ